MLCLFKCSVTSMKSILFVILTVFLSSNVHFGYEHAHCREMGGLVI